MQRPYFRRLGMISTMMITIGNWNLHICVDISIDLNA